MSNIVSVQFTRFQDLDDHSTPTGEPTLGYRICDDYGADYNNCFESVEEMRKAGLTREGSIMSYNVTSEEDVTDDEEE